MASHPPGQTFVLSVLEAGTSLWAGARRHLPLHMQLHLHLLANMYKLYTNIQTKVSRNQTMWETAHVFNHFNGVRSGLMLWTDTCQNCSKLLHYDVPLWVQKWVGWLMVEQGLTSHSTQFRSFQRRCFYMSELTQPTVSKHWRRVVSYPDSSQSHQAHLTMLQ